MKCQNCGKREVNFCYSSNINGCVTEIHLCAECAAESGYDVEQLFNAGSAFDEFFPIQSNRNGFLQVAIPMMDFSTVLPLVVRPRIGRHAQVSAGGCDCGADMADVKTVEVDDEMMKRRELNMQMQIAIENEDFEKAAQLRDEIKKL